MTQVKLIGLIGTAGVGKDTAADALRAEDWLALSFAAPIRAFIAQLCGVMVADLEDIKNQSHSALGGRTPRYAMQTLGSEWGRHMIDPKIWTRQCMRNVEHALRQGRNVVVTDVRTDDEADAIQDAGGQTVRILRPDQPGIASDHDPEQVHETERGIVGFRVDHELVNKEGQANLLRARLLCLSDSMEPTIRLPAPPERQHSEPPLIHAWIP